MKTSTHFLQWLTVVLLLTVNVMDTMGQATGPYPESASPHSVCLNSTEEYGVNYTFNSTYQWSISDPAAGTYTVGATPNLITVNWTKPGNFTLQVIETNQYNCEGAPVSIQVTVNPLPIVNPIIATTCSGVAAGIVLPTTSVNGLVIDKWDITAVVSPGLTGTATQGPGKTDPNAIATDAFTNTTSGPLTVVYTVIPYTGACSGAPFNITVAILPAPVVNPIINTTCSGVAAGVLLPVTSVNGLTINKWDITAVVAPGLTGAATQGLGKTDANAIAADVFTNTTNAPLTVVYTVTPYAGTCKGAPFTITATILPAPVVNPIITTTCSGVAAGVQLPVTSVNGLTINKWDITAVVAPGLTGSATQGAGKMNQNAIAADVFTNTTNAPLTVVYTVTPYAGTCKGAPFTVTVTILPAPVVNPIITTACSGDAVSVPLPVTSTNGLTVDKWDITAVVAPALTGSATQGPGKTDSNAITTDMFTNATNNPLIVVYTITPYAGTCKGASFTVTVTVYPTVKTSPIYHN